MKKLYDYIEEAIGWDYKIDLGEPVMYDETNTFLSAVVDELIGTPDNSNPVTKEESNILFCSYILGRYKNWNVSDDFIRLFVNVLVRNYEEHKILLDIYNEQKSNLMNGLKVTTDTAFNDTPQDYGTFTDNAHTTTTNHQISVSDGNTVIERISEISRKIEDIYQNWADEFVDLFIVPEGKGE